MKEVLKQIIKKIPIAFTQNQRYDKWTVQIIKKVCASHSNCIDIGCHKGEVLKEMLHFAPEGTHFGFEPLPNFYTYLQQHFPANCQFYNIALSNKKGETTFQYVVSNPAYSGLKKRRYARPDEEIQTIKVQMDLLDAVIPKDTSIDFIKIDVEGAELEVLKGGVKTIRRCRPVIVFEHGKGAADFYATRPEDIYELLHEQCGMHLSLLDRYLKELPPLSRQEFIRQYEEEVNYYFVAY
jgi:FkbM family methyltransferase